MLSEVLCALGIACGAVQPDVSGHTIMNLLDQTRGQAEFIVPALGSLYEDVTVKSQNETELNIELGRGQKPFSFVKCVRASEPPSCSFSYRDNVPRIEEFLGQSSQWTLQEVGPITQEGSGDLISWKAKNAEQEVVLTLVGNARPARAIIDVRWLK